MARKPRDDARHLTRAARNPLPNTGGDGAHSAHRLDRFAAELTSV
jgi:hypothetical protein